MMRRCAFTLVELLVVVGIIAVLMAILVPVLAVARKQASLAACGANQHTLIVAWLMYAEDNHGNIVGANTGPQPVWGPDGHAWDWVHMPMDDKHDTSICFALYTIKFEQNGIMDGVLYPYVKNVKSYHCPQDDRMSRRNAFYRSYEITAFANGMGPDDEPLYDNMVTRTLEIKQPSAKYIFLEEREDIAESDNQQAGEGNKCDLGNFEILPAPNNDITANDMCALWHNNSTTFAFADAHVEHHKWKDKRTLDYFSKGIIPTDTTSINPDLQWLENGICMK
jgi:prepilin-type N-terminal cleavage/methylation domain-containing protein/prepilin-type processing-associated H-X9-DG protein